MSEEMPGRMAICTLECTCLQLQDKWLGLEECCTSPSSNETSPAASGSINKTRKYVPYRTVALRWSSKNPYDGAVTIHCAKLIGHSSRFREAPGWQSAWPARTQASHWPLHGDGRWFR